VGLLVALLISLLSGAGPTAPPSVASEPSQEQPRLETSARLLAAAPPGPLVVAASDRPRLLFGTLLSDARTAPLEAQMGVQIAQLELGWDAYEPRDGEFDPAYAERMRQKLLAFQEAGLWVVLGAGLQYPPAWLLNDPDSRYVNQYGAANDHLNLTFNQALRARAERYLTRIDQDLGLNSFWAVRVGSGGLIETLYPPSWDGQHGNSYWAFDANAQGGPGRPSSIPPNPFPGWEPGQARYAGRPFGPDRVRAWYDWYLGALVDGVAWQIDVYRVLGFAGYVQVLMPGQGARPAEHERVLDSRLSEAADPFGSTSRGAVWHRLIGSLAGRAGLIVHISSLADGSGGDDACRPEDRQVGLGDPRLNGWSATRWISYNADRFGLAKTGENPGRADSRRYGPEMMESAGRQAWSCGLLGLMWAHAGDLHGGSNGLSLGRYASLIQRYAH
jgi:hypothetical protein